VTPAARFLLSRLLGLPVALFGLATLAFAVVGLVPGDPAIRIAGEQADPEVIAAIREDLGLDDPLPVRYVDYLGSLVQGDLGTSYFTGTSVAQELGSRVGSSFALVIPGIVVAVVLGVAAGTWAGFHRGGWIDRVVNSVISLGQSVPEFLVGVVLIYLLFFVLGFAPPPTGQLDFTSTPPPEVTGAAVVDALLAGDLATFSVAVSHLVLPVLTLAVAIAPELAKTTRAAVVESLNHPSIEFHRSTGAGVRTIVVSVVAQARTPVVTYVGIVVAALMGGSAVVELLFSWNGVGEWALESTTNLDVPVIQAVVLFYGAMSLIAYALLEVVVIALDPRLSFASSTTSVRARAVRTAEGVSA